MVSGISLHLAAQNSQFEKAFQQGIAASRSNQWEEAAADFAKAVALNQASAPAYLNLGLARLQLGQADEALAALNRAVALSPTSGALICFSESRDTVEMTIRVLLQR